MAPNLTRNPGLGTNARSVLSGIVSNGATWAEDVEITEDGIAVSGSPGSWTWRFIFRQSYDNVAFLTLSTADGTLAIIEGATSTILQIRVPYSSLSGMDGAYFADLASLDGSNTLTHWAHGIVTFTNEPLWS